MRLTKVAVYSFAQLSAMLLSWSAQATPVTVASDISNLYMGASSSTTGQFDINSSATALGFSSPVNVASATVSFLFQDNLDAYQTSTAFNSSTLIRLPDTCGSTLGSCVQHYYWQDRYDTVNYDPFETASVTIGSQTTTASSTYHQSTVGPSLTAQGYTSCGFLGCGFVPTTRLHCGNFLGTTICDGPWPVYTQSYTFYQAYDGAFSLSFNLDAAALLDLGTDGLLDFSLSAFAGDFNFLSASLTADIFERTGGIDPVDPIDPVTPVGVPEPTTSVMLLTGLLGLAARRKERVFVAPTLVGAADIQNSRR